MMSEFVLTTFDWVPELARGFVRDIRVRWALEEAELPYRIETVPIGVRDAEHFAHQPFGQVPWLTDGEMTIFESGATMMHLGNRSEKLMPSDERGRNSVVQWVFAALNSVETASLPWSIFKFSGDETQSPGRQGLDAFLLGRIKHMEAVLAKSDWLVGSFSIADILMADVLRLVDRFDGLVKFPSCRAYVERATSRAAFVKAHKDQLEHFALADLRQ